MIKQINILPSGSISDSSLALLGDPVNGALSQITYKSIKNYVQSGSTVSTAEDISVSTGSVVLGQGYGQVGDPAIINTLRELPIDLSVSDGIVVTARNVAVANPVFMMITPYSLQIEGNVSGGLPATFTLSDVSGSSLLIEPNSLTSSIISYGSSSITLFQNGNVLINRNLLVSGSYPGSASFAAFSSSYVTDSSSFDTRIKTISSSYFAFSGSYLNDSASFNTRINNVSSSFGSFSSSYLNDSSSFASRITIVSSSLGTLSASYSSDSASFNVRINNISSSFGSFSASYSLDSASFDTRINNTSSSFGSFSASYSLDSASFASRITTVSSSFGGFSASYVIDSSSFNTRINTVSSSFGSFSASYSLDSASFNTRINNTSSSFGSFSASYSINSASFSSSIALVSSSFGSFSASYSINSASFSGSIAFLSASFLTFSSSYAINSASFSGSIAFLSSSYLTFSSSYAIDSASFSGSIAFLSSSFRTFSSSYVVDSASFSGSIALISSSISSVRSGQVVYGNGSGSISGSNNFLWNFGTTQSLVIGNASSSISSSVFFYGNNFGTNFTSSYLLLINTTTASATLAQYSPSLMFAGQAFATTPSVSQTIYGAVYMQPQQSTNPIAGNLVFAFATASGTSSGPWNSAFAFSSVATNWTFGASGLTINPIGGAGLSLSSLPAAANSFHLGSAFSVQMVAAPSINSFGMLFFHSGNASYTGSSASTYIFSGSFTSLSGSGSWNNLNIQSFVSQSGSTGTTRGLFIQLNSTASVDYRAIETTTGSHIFAGPVIVNATGTLPSAGLTLGPGKASASAAPLKFISGTLLPNPESGSLEYDALNLYFATGSTRQIVMTGFSGSAPGNTTTPVGWLTVQFSGSFYKVPLYK